MSEKYIIGLSSLSKHLGCSRVTAWRMYHRGDLPKQQIEIFPGKKKVWEISRLKEAKKKVKDRKKHIATKFLKGK